MKKDGWYLASKEIIDEARKRSLALQMGITVMILTIIWGWLIYADTYMFVNTLFKDIINGEKITINARFLFEILSVVVLFGGVIYSIKRVKEYVKLKKGEIWVRTVILEESIIRKASHGTHDSLFFRIEISYEEDGKIVSREYPYDSSFTPGYLKELEGKEITVATSNFHNLIVLEEVYSEYR